MVEKLNPTAFRKYILERGSVGSNGNPAIAWFASSVTGKIFTQDGDWLTDGKGVLIRMPEWAKRFPAKVTKEMFK